MLRNETVTRGKRNRNIKTIVKGFNGFLMFARQTKLLWSMCLYYTFLHILGKLLTKIVDKLVWVMEQFYSTLMFLFYSTSKKKSHFMWQDTKTSLQKDSGLFAACRGMSLRGLSAG